MAELDLDTEFNKYVEIGSGLPPQTADNMLIAYAYFKQALIGDNHNPRPSESSNVIETFKHDAWHQLQGMTKDEAKKKYIETIKKLEKGEE